MTLRCNKVNMRLWVAGLRSGRFPQGHFYLAPIGDGVTSYCCLGVACVVAMENGVPVRIRQERGHHLSFNHQETSLPLNVLHWLGVDGCDSDPDPFVSAQNGWTTAVLANDGLKWTFEQIADALEVTYGLREDDVSLQDLISYVESQVPLLPTETQHQWELCLLTGCGVCGTHEGYECTNCRRVVDYQCDQDLAATIGLILALQVMH